MPTNYEEVYQESKRALGEPAKEFVTFFKSLQDKKFSVLDIGCGQGRDALFIARMGHSVVGVDISPTGIRDLLAEATGEALSITGHVVDIRDFEPDQFFDILLFNRTLHMLDSTDRRAVFARLIKSVAAGGYVLIADQRSNIPEIEAVLESSRRNWKYELRDRGYLFARLDE